MYGDIINTLVSAILIFALFSHKIHFIGGDFFDKEIFLL
jgi:hypothetical protein